MNENITDALAQLKAGFVAKLPQRLAEIRRLFLAITAESGAEESYSVLHREVHTLVGSAGTFGLPRLAGAARLLERLLVTPLPQVDIEALRVQLQSLEEVLQAELESLAPVLEAPEMVKRMELSPLIYIVEDSPEQGNYLREALEINGFRVRLFTTPGDFRSTCAAPDSERPAAVVMDMIFPEGDEMGITLITEMGLGKSGDIPVVVASVRDDLPVRLAAFRAGACRYLVKPVVAERLVDLLDALTGRQPPRRYRVLLVDDDLPVLEFHASLLRGAGMDVYTLSKPLQILAAVDSFDPDVVLLDVYMPEASGPELAAVLRERDAQLQLPILFLSTESDMTQQLLALNLGGDDFLVKPVQPAHLIAAITARARRARQNSVVRRRLEKTIYEREREHLALDQHAIVSVADRDGVITYANDRFCEISGYSRDEVIGQNHRILKSGQHSDEFYRSLWHTIASGRVWQGEVCNRRKDGSYYWVESTITPFLDGTGKPYQYVSIRTDITHMKEAEMALRQSEKRLDFLVSSSPVIIYTCAVTPPYAATYISSSVKNQMGYSPDEFTGNSRFWIDHVHPDDQASVLANLPQLFEHGSHIHEYRFRFGDGSYHWMHDMLQLVRDPGGRATEIIGYWVDITGRKEVELALAERERLLREAQTLASLGNWQVDMISGALSWSDEVYRIFGYEPGSFEPSQKTFLAAVHPEDLALVLESERLAEASGRHDVMHRIVRPSGEIRCVHELARAETDASGKLVRLVGTVQDITERRAMQAQLGQQKQLLDMLHHATTDFMEKGDFFATMSEMLTTLLALTGSEYGFTGEVLRDDNGAPYLKTHALTNIAWSAETRAWYEANQASGFEFRNLNTLFGHVMSSGKSVVSNHPATDPRAGGLPEGHPAMTAFLGVPIFYGDELIGMYALANRVGGYDEALQEMLQPLNTTCGVLIHSKRILEQEARYRAALVDAKEVAERASRTKSEFLSSMSHELRTPMNAILGFGQLMEYDATLPDEHRDSVAEILKAGHHLLTLINEVLDLAKVESGHINLSLEPVEVDSVVDESLSLVRTLAAKRDINIAWVGLKGATVRADRTRFKQALLNLLSNAIKYNREGGSVTLRVRSEGAERLRLLVTDTGRGIAPQQIKALFEPFNRLDAANSGIEGTGIGLTITRRIVEMMGGRVEVESEVGVGSTFWIELPLESLFNAGESQEQVDEARACLQGDEMAQRTVLYIEDNPANLRLVSQLLGRRKHIHLLTAHLPGLGIELALAHRPALILLDINMPGMDGYEVLERFKGEASLSGVPIVAVTANAMPRDIARGKAAGFSDYLTKPINVQLFLATVDHYLFNETERQQ